ncbi:methylmalonyl-CoA mutase family protein [Desulfosediminicola ganghwensis]|uniref:methylmalonyl-CoA mutase family protein n=1 Tax=Desulfosediminicola ganghwensis TaxID=2569540 RepID=UPI0010ACF37D|nr:methylmalonyl-CoA mutase family protein [Desulfosediminicola ganghwensis]
MCPKPKSPIRILTAVAHYDGHDASILAINRALLQHPREVEIIYTGFNMAAEDICTAAVQEDVHGIAIASYNGGHMQFFQHLAIEVQKRCCRPVCIFGGGGATITEEEAHILKTEGISNIYRQGISLTEVSDDIVQTIDRNLEEFYAPSNPPLPVAISLADLSGRSAAHTGGRQISTPTNAKVIVITGDGGAGKSTLIDELIFRFRDQLPGKRVAILANDPTTVSAEGTSAFLADRVRMNYIYDPNIFMRSLSTGNGYISQNCALPQMAQLCIREGYDLVIIETPGVGQAGLDLKLLAPDLTICVKTREYGSALQLAKDQMLQEADMVVLNKIDLAGSEAAYQEIGMMFPPADRSKKLFGVLAKMHRDKGMDHFFAALCERLGWQAPEFAPVNIFEHAKKMELVPYGRRNYLAEVVKTVRDYDQWARDQLSLLRQDPHNPDNLDPFCRELLENWPGQWQETSAAAMHKFGMTSASSSANDFNLPMVALPDPQDLVESLRFLLEEGLPGSFPYGTGIYPYRLPTAGETTRQFAGLRGPEETNQRLHLLNRGVATPRLSIAFDGITLYGDDSDSDPSSMGKIGEGGVSVDSYEDMKLILKGFDIRKISTSLTINGPAPVILAMYFVAAGELEQEREEVKRGAPMSEKERDTFFNQTCRNLRGTVQADILKEVQAQNECIFQTDFSLKMLGDIQSHFIEKKINSYYSMSISGYHIGEAGATPAQELAFTLANGFTYVEYFLKRGMAVDAFAPSLSFFFRVSHEAEWLAYGPVCRRIWAIAMRDRYQADDRSQRFKFHTQTSGRALQAAEWDTLNPIRQTYHAYMGLLNNTNSLHVDSADEPMTTPSEKFVRQATLIPNYLSEEAEAFLIQNLLSGSYSLRAVTSQLQEKVLQELERIDQLGGVGPATEMGYQRNSIAESSARYEWEKYPPNEDEPPPRKIIGFNTYIQPVKNEAAVPEQAELIRPTKADWERQIRRTRAFRQEHKDQSGEYLQRLEHVALSGGNIFSELLHTVRHATLGEITRCLRKAGGSYRKMV